MAAKAAAATDALSRLDEKRRPSLGGMVSFQRLERAQTRMSNILGTKIVDDEDEKKIEMFNSRSSKDKTAQAALREEQEAELQEDDDEGGTIPGIPYAGARAAALKWLKPWRGGKARSVEMEAVCGSTADCLAAAGDTIACIGGDGDGLTLSTYSAKRSRVVKSLVGHADHVLSLIHI